MLWDPLCSSANVSPTTAPSARTPAPTPMGAPQASTPIHPASRHKQLMLHQGGHGAVGPNLDSSGPPYWPTTLLTASPPPPWPSLPSQLLAQPPLSAPPMPLTAPAVSASPIPPATPLQSFV
ncbi:hypothetical protein E4T56_gene878 [Termitomyces sp. T112]|nr:hypothetical protein E4T56_gene878 [Termitomyces sp. T112]